MHKSNLEKAGTNCTTASANTLYSYIIMAFRKIWF